MFKNLNPAALGVSGHQSEIIELTLTYGFTGIDVNMSEFVAGTRLKGTGFARRLYASAKLQIASFPLPIAWDTDDDTFQKDLKKLAECAVCAAEMGCTRTTALLAPANNDRPYHDNFEFHRRRLQEICTVLSASSVRLAVGFEAAEYCRRDKAFEFIHDLDALTMLLNMVSAPESRLAAGYLGGRRLWRIGRVTAKVVGRADCGRSRGRNARRHSPAGLGRELPSVAGHAGWTRRRGRFPDCAEGDGLRRTGHGQTVSLHLPESPPRRGRQANCRGLDQSLAGRRSALAARLRVFCRLRTPHHCNGGAFC